MVCSDKNYLHDRTTEAHKGCDETQGLTFEQIAKAINKDEVWVAALFYGQVSPIPSFVNALIMHRTNECRRQRRARMNCLSSLAS